MLFNESTGNESVLSDRGKPFCGGGLCCRAKDSLHPGDPGCFESGCHGRHCCWDPTKESRETESTRPYAIAARAPAIGEFSQSGKNAACYVTGSGFGSGDFLPATSFCKLRFQGVRRWWNKCGLQIPFQSPPGIKDPLLNMTSGWDNRTQAFRWASNDYKNCIFFPSGSRTVGALTTDKTGRKHAGRRMPTELDQDSEGGEYHDHTQGSMPAPAGGMGARRSYVRYETYIDKKLGYYVVEEGEEPLIQWRINPQFRSEDYRLALQWVDCALGSRSKGFMSTLPFQDPNDDVVNGFLYNIDTEAGNTHEARSTRFPPHRRARNGTNSWQRETWMGPCTYPIGFPPYGTRTSYNVRLFIYRARRSREIKHPATWKSFMDAVQDDLVGDCMFQPKAEGGGKQGSRSADAEGLYLTRPGEVIQRCDGLYKSQNLSNGHNQTVPCGAYGCDCRFSPGNCGQVI